jgi:hypothetical protein
MDDCRQVVFLFLFKTIETTVCLINDEYLIINLQYNSVSIRLPPDSFTGEYNVEIPLNLLDLDSNTMDREILWHVVKEKLEVRFKLIQMFRNM